MASDIIEHLKASILSIASALSSTLTIYPCQIRVHQSINQSINLYLNQAKAHTHRHTHACTKHKCWQSKLQLPTAQKEWRPATAGSSLRAVTCQHCDTHYFSRPRTRGVFPFRRNPICRN